MYGNRNQEGPDTVKPISMELARRQSVYETGRSYRWRAQCGRLSLNAKNAHEEQANVRKVLGGNERVVARWASLSVSMLISVFFLCRVLITGSDFIFNRCRERGER